MGPQPDDAQQGGTTSMQAHGVPSDAHRLIGGRVRSERPADSTSAMHQEEGKPPSAEVVVLGGLQQSAEPMHAGNETHRIQETSMETPAPGKGTYGQHEDASDAGEGQLKATLQAAAANMSEWEHAKQ